MPVLRFKPGRVEEVLRLSLEEALRVVERLKVEAEVTEDGMVEFEVEVDRPDMFSLEGIARQADGLLGRACGLPVYNVVEDTGYTLRASSVEQRPYIAAGIVWDVNVDEDYLEELIQLQEKLHLSIGRGRRRVAIGLHDLDKLPGRTLEYRSEPVDSVVFRPLGYSEAMSLRRVLEETEQGRKYGSISLSGEGLHPVLRAGGEVISVPPVINAETTRIEPGTRHVFIDVTGTELKPVLDTLAILASSLAERSSSRRVGVVRVEAPWGSLSEPRLEPSEKTASASYIAGVLGVSLTASQIAEHLERMRYGVRSVSGDALSVLVPRYRIDVLHQVDLAEDVALSIGLDDLEPKKPKLMLRGSLIASRFWEREARKLLAGMGFVEVIGYSLVPCWYNSMVGLGDVSVELENPVGVESACLRASLLPGLLEVAAANRHRVPLKVFERGEAVVSRPGSETGVAQRKLLAVLYMGEKAGYEDVQSVVYTLIRLLGDRIASVREAENPLLIKGRAAHVETEMGVTALIGEVHPENLEKFDIDYPVAVAEIDYTGLSVPRP